MTPNTLMLQFLRALIDNADTGLDPLETALAVAVGKENGWITPRGDVSDEGHKVVRRAIFPPLIPKKKPLPAILWDAYMSLANGQTDREKFEAKYQLPARSAKAIVGIAKEIYG